MRFKDYLKKQEAASIDEALDVEQIQKKIPSARNKARSNYERAAKTAAKAAAEYIIAEFGWLPWSEEEPGEDIDSWSKNNFDDQMAGAGVNGWDELILSTLRSEAEKRIKAGKIKFK